MQTAKQYSQIDLLIWRPNPFETTKLSLSSFYLFLFSSYNDHPITKKGGLNKKLYEFEFIVLM